SVQPKKAVLERELDSVDIAVIGVVRLPGNAADGSIGVDHRAHQQACFRVEIHRSEETSGTSALNNIDWLIIDTVRIARAQIGEDLLDAAREGQFGIQPHTIQVISGYFKLTQQAAR